MFAFYNGSFLPLSDVHISPLDRGFLFGDGIYEALPVFNGVPFKLEEHLRRLIANLEKIRLTTPHTYSEWVTIVRTLIETNAKHFETGNEQSLYLQITRGAEPIRRHRLPDNPTPTIFVTTFPRENHLPIPVTAILRIDARAHYLGIKTLSLLPSLLLNSEAREEKADEVILLKNGKLTESTSSNVIVIRDGTLYTPSSSPAIVSGVTREIVLELAQLHHYPHQVRNIPRSWLFDAEEIWLVASIREIAPVIQLNNKPIGEGKPGPIWQQFYGWYESYKKAYCLNALETKSEPLHEAYKKAV